MDIKKLSTIVGIVVALGSLLGGAIAYDNSIMSTKSAKEIHTAMNTGYQVQLDLIVLESIEDKVDTVLEKLKDSPMSPILLNRLVYLQKKIEILRLRIDSNIAKT